MKEEQNMDLMYASTRDADVKATASQAILKGLSDDGGLFVPERIPALDVSLQDLAGMTYQETAYTVMKQLTTANLTRKKLPRLSVQTASIFWSCSMVQRLLLKIWHYRFCRT